ncbi:hypothetical protein MRX96_027824 [Rhipicephalus microplus]
MLYELVDDAARPDTIAVKCTAPQCVRCGAIGHDQCALKPKHGGCDHSPSTCKAQTKSSAAPPVASSSFQKQVSSVADDRHAAPMDAKGSTQPQQEPISEGAPGREQQEAGSKSAEAPHHPCCRRALVSLAFRCARDQPWALQEEAGGGFTRRPRQLYGLPSSAEATRSDEVGWRVYLVDHHRNPKGVLPRADSFIVGGRLVNACPLHEKKHTLANRHSSTAAVGESASV